MTVHVVPVPAAAVVVDFTAEVAVVALVVLVVVAFVVEVVVAATVDVAKVVEAAGTTQLQALESLAAFVQ